MGIYIVGSWHLGRFFFDHIRAPSLNDLEVDSTPFSHWPYLFFVTLLSQSVCNLERLHLINAEMTSEACRQMLRSLPSLISLHIEHMPFFDGMDLNTLVFVEGRNDNLLPKLEILHLHLAGRGPCTNLLQLSLGAPARSLA
jgi:hypothetical protein